MQYPTQLTMCHALTGTLPRTTEQLNLKLPGMAVFQGREKKMKNNFDSRHSERPQMDTSAQEITNGNIGQQETWFKMRIHLTQIQ